jgi:putative tricarboxylic transport membrane protein
MVLRADHVAGAAFILAGLGVFLLSGELPFGGLSMPGSGFMPSLVASLLLLFGALLCARAAESQPLKEIDWSDAKHAGLVVLITALAIVAYTRLGFIITMMLMLFALLVIIERRNLVKAALYSIAATLLAYALFDKFLRAPLPNGPLGF